jgi:hypothetical protein
VLSADHQWLADGFGRNSIAKIVSDTEQMKKMHPYMSVLKLPLLVELEQKVGKLVLYKTSSPSVIISENTLI